jgi:voltage-gated potassium channel
METSVSMETTDWRSWVRSVLDGEHLTYGRPFEIFLQVLIVTSLVSVTTESLPGLTERMQTLLRWEEMIIVAVFTIEYVLRATTAERPFGYDEDGAGLSLSNRAIIPAAH